MAFGDEAWAILLADLEPAFAPAFLSVLAVALGLLWLYGFFSFWPRAKAELSETLQSEDSADALLANKKMRALRRGLMIMDVALHPLGKASKKMREQRRVRATKRSDRGDGLRRVHSLPSETSPRARAAASASTSAPHFCRRSRCRRRSRTRRPRRTRRRRASSAASSCCWLEPRLLGELAQIAATRAVGAGEAVGGAALSVVLSGEVELRAGTSSGGALIRTFGAGSRCTGLLELLGSSSPRRRRRRRRRRVRARRRDGRRRGAAARSSDQVAASAVCRPPHADAGVGGDAPRPLRPLTHAATWRHIDHRRRSRPRCRCPQQPAQPRSATGWQRRSGAAAGNGAPPLSVALQQLAAALHLPDDAFDELAPPAELRTLAPGETFDVSRLPSHLILPLAGTIDAVPPAADGSGGGGRSRLVTGELYGLLQVLAADTADLKLVAADDGGAAEVLLLPGRAFRQLCRRHLPLLARCAGLLRASLAVRLLDHASEWMQLRGGEALERARGAVYVVLCGRLLESAAVAADGAAGPRRRRSVGVGGSIGEGELLAPPSDAAAAAGAVATRDSQLVMLPGALLTGAAAAVEPAHTRRSYR